MNIASRTLTKSGAYLLGQAKKLARGLWKRSLRFSTARQAIDGYIVEGKRCGNVGSATVYDPLGMLVIPGSGPDVWPYSVAQKSDHYLCAQLPSNRDLFYPPFVDGDARLSLTDATAIVSNGSWVGDAPTMTSSIIFSARPIAAVGAGVSSTFIGFTQTSQAFAYGTGVTWLGVVCATPSNRRLVYIQGEPTLRTVDSNNPPLGVLTSMAPLLAPLGDAYGHPPRPAGGWDEQDGVVAIMSPASWCIGFPYPSDTQNPNWWVAVQFIRARTDPRDYIGRRCVLLVNILDVIDDNGSASFHYRTVGLDPASLYPGRSAVAENVDSPTWNGWGKTAPNSHCPSNPVVLSTGTCVFFDAYFAETADRATRLYTLSITRVAGGSAARVVVHTSDIVTGHVDPGTYGFFDMATVSKYHFEGADVSDADIVVGVVFGHELAATQTLTIYRVEAGAVTAREFTPEFTRCVFGHAYDQTGVYGDTGLLLPFELHRSSSWGFWARLTAGPELSNYVPVGWCSGADKVTYIGNHKWMFYVSTDVFQDPGLASFGSWSVAVYDDTTESVALVGTIMGADPIFNNPTRRMGRIDCVIPELANNLGEVTRQATLVATIGGGSYRSMNPGGISQGATFISYDSGESWAQILDCGSPGGAVYCGNVLQARTDPIARGL